LCVDAEASGSGHSRKAGKERPAGELHDGLW
jgi:hypothetical protein